MAYVQVLYVDITTDGSGDATVYTAGVNGLLSQLRYVKTDFADGVDFVVTLEDTGQILWDEDNVNASATRAPRQATHDTVGVAALYAGAGQAVNDLIAVNGRIKVVVAAGGATKTGRIYFTII